MITVVGSLAVNILTVLILALAVLVLRALHNPDGAKALAYVYTLGILAASAGLTWVQFTKSRLVLIFAWIGMPIYTLSLISFLLAIIGDAAGLK